MRLRSYDSMNVAAYYYTYKNYPFRPFEVADRV